MKFDHTSPNVSTDVAMLQTMGQHLANITALDADSSNKIFSFESAALSENTIRSAEVQVSNLRSVLAAANAAMNIPNAERISSCEEAAIQGFVLAGATRALSTSRRSSSILGDKRLAAFESAYAVSAEHVPSFSGQRHPAAIAALESFNPVEQRNAALYTFAFNYIASRQEDFGETLYPTLTLPQDQVGFGIVVNRLTVHKGWVHRVDGAEVEMGKIDLVRAARDATVLSRNKTKLVPVVRSGGGGNTDKFVAAGDVAPAAVTVDGISVTTAPIKTGVTVNILGLSQTDAQIVGGISNQTDTLEPAISLNTIYVKFGDDVLSFNVYQRHGANFVYGQQGFNEKRRLNFDGGYLTLSKDTKLAAGTDVTELTLAKLASEDVVVVFGVTMTGDVNTESGNMSVYGNAVKFGRILERNTDGTLTELAAANALTVEFKAFIETGTVIGYDVNGWKSNANMRENGDYIDRSQFIQLFEVPLLSPVTAQNRISSNGESDSSDFETLVTTTRFRLYTDVVTAVIDQVNRVRDFCSVPISHLEAPQGLGASRFHVKPSFAELTGTSALDCLSISGNNTFETIKNLQALVVNKLRDIAFSLYQQSEYQAAQMALGQTNKPTLVIATDTILARYILVDGELRTLTDRFDYKVVSTLDSRFDGRIFLSFISLDGERNQTPNILTWGNLIWGAEAVLNANMPTGDTISRKTIVQPRYLFAHHLPVCGWIEVKNLHQVFDQSFLRTKAV